MKLLIAALFVACASAASVDNCAWGESYWCSSLKVAKQCDAVQHCISTVWSHQEPYKEDNADLCQYCENFIQDVKNFIDSNETEATIQKYLDQACSIIPISQVADECKDYVDNYLPELFQMISSKLNPKAICSALWLCKGFSDKVHHPGAQNLLTLPIRQKSGDVCSDCKTLVKDFQNIIQDNTTEQEVEDFLKQTVCTMLGTLESECNDMVQSYVPEILQMLADTVDPEQICELLGLCGTKNGRLVFAQMRIHKSPLFKAAQKIQSAETCVICKTVFTELQNLDRNQNVQKEVEDFIKQKLCSQLGSLQKECQDTVDQYGPFLFELLVSELDPDTRCRSLGFCATDEDNQIHDTVQKATPVKVSNKVGQSTQCVLCEFIMKEIDDLLKQNSSEQAIIQALEKVCSVLPDTIKEQCDDFVEQYAQAIIELLVQELSPDQICATLGLCTNQKLTFVPHVKLPKSNVKNDEYCGICKTIIQYVDSLLEENSTVQEIEQVVMKVCSFLPSNIRQECDDFVKQYGPAVIELLAQFADPKTVCTELGLCTASKTAHPQMLDLVMLAPAQPRLVGANKCTWGPAYWCDKRENAEECGTVEHCEKHVWSKN